MTKHQQTCMSIPMSNDIMLLHLYYLLLFFIPFVFVRNSRNLSDACNWARKLMQCVHASYLFIKMGWREEFDFEIPCFSPCFSLLALIRTQFWTLKMIFNKSKVRNVILETIKALTPAVISPFPVLLRLNIGVLHRIRSQGKRKICDFLHLSYIWLHRKPQAMQCFPRVEIAKITQQRTNSHHWSSLRCFSIPTITRVANRLY